MRSSPWRRILSSAMVFATVAVGLVGSSGTWAAGESKEYEELGRSLEHVLAEDLVREFMETILGGALDGCAGEALLVSYISKEYFESRWLDPNDFKVNFYHFSEFRIIEAEPPYVDVEIMSSLDIGWTALVRFKVVEEQDKFVFLPSRAEKTEHGNWVDAWWGVKEEWTADDLVDP